MFAGCLSFRLPKPVQELKVVERLTLDVEFLGSPADKDGLVVCGWADPDTFSCIEFQHFMNEYQEQNR